MRSELARRMYKRYEKISYILNDDAYKRQTSNRTTPLKQFLPCEKALRFTEAMGNDEGEPSGVVIAHAAARECVCHPEMTKDKLWEIYAQVVKTETDPDIFYYLNLPAWRKRHNV